VFRGVFANWWQQGADSVMTFNWACAEPEWCEEMGGEVAPLSQLTAYQEVGSPSTLAGKDKTFVVERRGGYPWADGYFNRNSDSPLPAEVADNGTPLVLTVCVADPLCRTADSLRDVALDLVLFGTGDSARFEVQLNGTPLVEVERNPEWKDPQIFSPKPEPASGGQFSRYRIDPRQRLLRLRYAIDPACCLVGKNQIEIRSVGRSETVDAGRAVLEKLEVAVRYQATCG
jgi:hypothetical protein